MELYRLRRYCILLLSVTVVQKFDYTYGKFDSRTISSLVNGGYENVTIAISDAVIENSQLISRIKSILTDFSEALYEATNKGAFIRTVNILLPLSWSDSESYIDAVLESFENADIRLDVPPKESDPQYYNVPYTNKPTHCGEPGFYIHLTPEYILDQNIAAVYGSYSSVLLHEWAQNRWGVFDEAPLEDDDRFYTDSEGEYQATRCSKAVRGTFEGGLSCTEATNVDSVNANCEFKDSTSQGANPIASLMYKPYLDQASQKLSTLSIKNGK